MPRSPDEKENVGVSHGRWGEEVAVAELRVEGFEIVERNVHPCKDDRRIELDVIAYDPRRDLLVFVEVKQHKARSARQRRLRSLDRRKRMLVGRGCRAWLLRHHWQGAYRFDVIEVYGTPESGRPAEVDHVEHVRLFKSREQFVDWEN